METDATHFGLPLDGGYDYSDDDVANSAILTVEVSYMVPSRQDVLVNGSLRVRIDVVPVATKHFVDGDNSRLETTSDTLQVQITDTLQLEHVLKDHNLLCSIARTMVWVYQDTYMGVHEESSPHSGRFHDENDIRDQSSCSQQE